MSFADQSHINHVRDALWKRSAGASIMVGAGFSRNAEKARPDAPDSPTWSEVSESILSELYPLGDDRRRQVANSAISETSGLLRLAQEYEAAFGPSDLHKFIAQRIRDDDFKPGNMHSRLLRLPWRDVFTTNWDTLLERTRSSVIERAYSVVHNMDEIPLVARPRIVKLHGSVPAHFPLIVTEENYRTYPVQFAPFVNTVQQAMMETVFCLIGFSGNDPNFLQWSGWVRDNLGAVAPKVYLAGWLDLSPPRRRMLEDRNVVAIDLARHPKANRWPEHLRDRYSTDWLLHSLEYARPYDVANWPSPSNRHDPEPQNLLEPVDRVVSAEPKVEPEMPSGKSGSEDQSGPVRKVLEIWAHNRKMYPGWLAVPTDAQYMLSYRTREWEPLILRALSDFEPVDRLYAIHELIWRREVLLEPISADVESAAKEVLEEIDCESRTINGGTEKQVDWVAARKAWRMIALALVTMARLALEREAFDQRLRSLSVFQDDDPDVAQRIHHERCLWTIYSLDYEALENLLKDWHAENCDPVWILRKAALLFETGDHDDAEKLVGIALATIREYAGDERSTAESSREGWALCLAMEIEGLYWWKQDANRPDRASFFRRWRELASLKCDANSEIRDYANAIRTNNENNSGPPFDLGIRQIRGIRFSNEKYYRWLAALRAIRLSEIAALPASTAPEFLKFAVDELFLSDPELAARLILRIAKSDRDDGLTRILARHRVAAMPAESVTKLAQICSDVIEHALPRIVDAGTQRNHFWDNRLQVAMEALSRFVVRLDPDPAESIFSKALEWYGHRTVAGNNWLSNPVRSILKRSWEALPEDRQANRILDLLSTPIVGLDGFSASSPLYPDPVDVLSDAPTPLPRTPDNENRWQESVRFLVHGLRGGEEAHRRAARRISWTPYLDRLNDAEKASVALALWGDNYINHSDLPAGKDIYDWGVLTLPEPVSGLAERRFREKWINTERATGEEPSHRNNILWNVGSAIRHMKINGKPLKLSDPEREYLATLVTRWSETPVPPRVLISESPDLIYHREDVKETLHAIEGLKSVLLEINISKSTAEKLYKKITVLNESNIPGLGLTAGLIKALPKRFDNIVLLMKMGLASDDDRLAEDAVRGLWFWLYNAANSNHWLQPPPEDLVREIGIIIAMRRNTVLGLALRLAKVVFTDGDPGQRAAIDKLTLHGLGYLAQELRYDRSHDPDVDVPLLRWCCTQLALAMAACGFENDPAVARWIENAKNDPLPEVRHAKRPATAAHSEEESDPDHRMPVLE